MLGRELNEGRQSLDGVARECASANKTVTNAAASRLFAVIPAAGLSRRMGQPKLLLPLGESTVITRLLETLRVPEVTDIVIVMRRGDQDLFNEVQESGATIVQPDVDPPDMRDSVEHAIEAIRKSTRLDQKMAGC
ncbi:MAG: hypothetical protein CMJ78_12275 [Planctomycetaceae bacterium]|nr:hypothetical protein [Planctomycetaceae bacterium]